MTKEEAIEERELLRFTEVGAVHAHKLALDEARSHCPISQEI